MAIEHNVLPNAELHEPKDVDTATVGTVYVANSSNSGDWAWPATTILQVRIPDISTASTHYIPCSFGGTIDRVHTVIDGAIATSDAIVTVSILTTAVTSGAVTVAFSGSAAGDVDAVTPSALNTFALGDYIKVVTDGASTNTVVCNVALLCTRTS